MKVTVLMPVYNGSEFLALAIESVLRQTHADLELIVINDGSTDQSKPIAESFAQADPRVKVFSTPNQGVAKAMNLGLQLAKTEWIAVMHADDIMYRHRLESQLMFVADHPELSFASSSVHHIDAAGRVIGHDNSKLTTPEAVDAQFEAGEPIGFVHPAVIFKKSAVLEVGGYRQQFWPAEDLDLWNRMLESGHKLLIQPEHLISYRIHGKSASIASARVTRFKVRWIQDCMNRRRSGGSELSEKAFINQEREMGLLAIANRERKDTARIFYKSAVFHFAKRSYMKTALNAFVAVFLRPVLMAREITSKLDLSPR
jgi:glycosyltransferase involved in cell wall biosynthesis